MYTYIYLYVLVSPGRKVQLSYYEQKYQKENGRTLCCQQTSYCSANNVSSKVMVDLFHDRKERFHYCVFRPEEFNELNFDNFHNFYRGLERTVYRLCIYSLASKTFERCSLYPRKWKTIMCHVRVFFFVMFPDQSVTF